MDPCDEYPNEEWIAASSTEEMPAESWRSVMGVKVLLSLVLRLGVRTDHVEVGMTEVRMVSS